MILYKRRLTQLDGKMGPALRVAYMDVVKGRENGCGSFAYTDGKDCSRQSRCISTIHGGHSKGREKGCGSFNWHFFRGNSNMCSVDRP